MTLSDQLSEYIRACFTGIWIQSHEHVDALLELAGLCQQERWQLGSWNIDQGMRVAGASLETGNTDPLAAIRSAPAISTPEGTTILVLQNFHRFIQSAEIVQALAQQIVAGKQTRTFYVILSPVVQIPVELEKLFVVVEHELPGREQLDEIARAIATEEGELPEQEELNRVLDAAAGLTRYEAEGAFSLSLVREGRLTPSTLWRQKAQMLKKGGTMSLYRGGEDFSSLGGLASLKAFTRRALLQPTRENPLRRPRGVLLLSPPGCGKSQFCKSLGQEVGRPVLVLDVGSQDSPVLCRDDCRRYTWALFAKGSALGPNEEAIRIESSNSRLRDTPNRPETSKVQKNPSLDKQWDQLRSVLQNALSQVEQLQQAAYDSTKTQNLKRAA